MVPTLWTERSRNSDWNRGIWRYDWGNRHFCSVFQKNLVSVVLGQEPARSGEGRV